MRKTWLIIIFSFISSMAFADDEIKEVTVDGLNYSCNLTKQTATVIAGDYSKLRKVTIPGSVACDEKDCIVTDIGKSAFSGCENITSVTFPSSLKNIQDDAFYGCRKLNKLQLPEGLEEIGGQAFYGCSMPEVIIPEGVKSVGYWAFNSNSFLKKVELPSTLTSIENMPFDQTMLSTLISHITEPLELSEYVFGSTKAILFVPKGLREKYMETEGWNVFPTILEGERGEATVNGLNFVFDTQSDVAVLLKGDYTVMEELNIPGVITVDEKKYTVTEIQDEAFNWCIFKEAVIPEGVVKIGAKVFIDCNNLIKVILPSTLKEIGSNAFHFNYDNPIPSIICHMKEPCQVYGGDIGLYMLTDFYTNTMVSYGMEYYYPNPYLYVPEGTKAAYEAAEGWKDCSLIIEGDPLETVYQGYHFVCATSSKEAMLVKGDYDGNSDDEQLKDIVIPQTITVGDTEYTVTIIGEKALSELYNINSITVPNTVYAVCPRAFMYSRPAKQFNMPPNLKKIGCEAFHGFEGFKNYYEPIVVPEGVEGVGYHAFNLRAESISLPSTLKRVWHNAFAYESGGGDIKYLICHMENPCLVINTGGWGYANMNRYTVYVPQGCRDNYLQSEAWKSFKEILEGEIGVTTVDGINYRWETGNHTAWLIEGDYKKYESVDIPATITVGKENEQCTVTKIGSWAFAECHNLESVKFPSTLKTLEFRAFWECTNLMELNLPVGLEEIGDGVFYSCKNLQNLTLPVGLRTIGNTAFASCSNVEEIELPFTLDKINFQAFNGTDYDVLTKVNSHIKYPFPIDLDVFESGSERFTNAELHVPKGTLEDYQSTEYWSEFKTIIDDLPEELGDVNDDYIVDDDDVKALVNYLMGDKSADINMHEADLNGDNVVTLADLVMLINKFIGK